MPPPPANSGFRQRLGYYACGLGIGFCILGFFWWARAQAAKNAPPAPQTQPASPR